MTIKPLLSQKSTKHEKSDIQDVQSATLAISSTRPAHRNCLNQKTTTKSPSPQRELKSTSTRSHVFDAGIAGVGVSGRRRRSPHKRIHHKRDVARGEQRNDKTCKSPSTYQVECPAVTSCSSPHSSSGKSPKTSHGSVGPTLNNNNNVNNTEESYSGYNSGDEHICQKDAALTVDEWDSRDKTFIKMMADRGFNVNEIAEDGACLFRSISLQIYGDQEMHEVIRQQTMDYIFKNREYFAQFVTEDITSYVSRKRNNHVHGNHIEIQAISEIYNRPVELYCYQAEPINIFNSDQIKQGYEPLRLSYQRGSHYNAILNPYKATVGVGLGLAGYRPEEPDLKQMHDAVRLSEDLEIEQTMFEDKLKTTDWDATNEAIEEQIARESYLQWCRDNMQKEPQKQPVNASSSTVTSSDLGSSAPNKSPSFSGDDSEDYTPYPSDEERCNDYGAGSSSASGIKSENSKHIYFVQQQRQQRRRKRRRGTTASDGNTIVEATSANNVAGPSSSATATTSDTSKSSDSIPLPEKQQELWQHTSPKISKHSPRSTNDDKPKPEELPGPSKPNSIEEEKSSSTFYHDLLQSSYSDDFFDVGQLSEEKMLQKALQMSRMDFMQKIHKPDSDPPSP